MISTTHPTIFLLSPELCPLLPVELGAAGVSAAHVGGVAVTVGGAVREAGHAHTRHVVIHRAQPGHHHHHNIHHAQPGHGASGSAETRCSNKLVSNRKEICGNGIKGEKNGWKWTWDDQWWWSIALHWSWCRMLLKGWYLNCISRWMLLLTSPVTPRVLGTLWVGVVAAGPRHPVQALVQVADVLVAEHRAVAVVDTRHLLLNNRSQE